MRLNVNNFKYPKATVNSKSFLCTDGSVLLKKCTAIVDFSLFFLAKQVFIFCTLFSNNFSNFVLYYVWWKIG